MATLAAPGTINAGSAINGTTITASTQFSGSGAGLTGTASSLSIGGTATNLSGTPNITVGTVSAGAISCSTISGTATHSISYGQTGSPASGMFYGYNPNNTAGSYASCNMRIAGATASAAYYSLDVSGVNGYSWGITGASQNLVYRASWDFSSGTIFTFDRSGNFTAAADVIAYSDRRYKTDLERITGALDKVSRINGYTFVRTDLEDKRRKAGVIAQEIQEVLPEVVQTTEDGTLSVAYGNIVALLIEAIKELREEVKILKKGNEHYAGRSNASSST